MLFVGGNPAQPYLLSAEEWWPDILAWEPHWRAVREFLTGLPGPQYRWLIKRGDDRRFGLSNNRKVVVGVRFPVDTGFLLAV